MTNFKEYFRSHIKASVKPIIYILVAVVSLTFLMAVDAQPSSHYDYIADTFYPDYRSTLYIPSVAMIILSYVIPIMEFSFFKKRINLDCAYSLPISRRAMGTVHYLTGLFILLGAFTASYLTNFALLLSRGPGWFNLTPMIGHYFLCLLLGFVIYSIMVFAFNEANTKGDGIWFMILYTFVLFFIVSAFTAIIDTADIFMTSLITIPWGLISMVTTNYQFLVEIELANNATFWQTPEHVGWFIFWIILGIAAAVGFFLTFGKRRMERTEEISDSYLGFRVLIPLYAICGMISFEVSHVAIFWIIIELLALLGYTIYRRGFHYKKLDIAILLSLVIFLFV